MSDISIEIKKTPAKRPLSSYLKVSILCLMIGLGGFVFGWDTGTISGFVNMDNFIERFGQINSVGSHYLSTVRTGLLVSIFNIGCAIGAIFLSHGADLYGRRIGLLIMMAIYIIGVLIQITSFDKWYQYFVGRIIAGLAVGGTCVISPLFISESAPKHIRPALISSFQLMCTFGMFLAYCVNFGTKKIYSNSPQWRIPLGLSFVWATIMTVGLLIMPESPRYLIKKGLLEQARKSLAYLNNADINDEEISKEIDEISETILKESTLNSSIRDLTEPKVFFRLVCGVLIMAFQQLTGNNYFFYYGTTIFNSVGLTDPFETSIVLGIVNFASTMISIYSVHKLGGRKSLLIGSIGMIICFSIFATVGVTSLYPNGKNGRTSTESGNVMVVFACLYIYFFASTWGPCANVIVSEIYPIKIKARAMGISYGSFWLWGFLIAFFTPFITRSIGFYYGYVFLGCLVFSFFFVYLTIPDTRGLTLEQIDKLYSSGEKPWKTNY